MRFKIALGLVLCGAVATTALAQYGGGMGGGGTPSGGGGVYTAPKGGYSSSTGIAIGAGVAAGIGLAYLALHNRGKMVGCVEGSADGTKLMNEKDKKTYALLASNDVVLAPGERVAIKGKKVKDESGRMTFQVQKLLKDYGSCSK